MGGLLGKDDEQGRALDDEGRREADDSHSSAKTSAPSSGPEHGDTVERHIEDVKALLLGMTEEQLNRPIQRGYKLDLPELKDLRGEFFHPPGDRPAVQPSSPQVPPPAEPHV